MARSSAGIALKAVGEKFVAIGSRKNLLTANSFPRWSYSQSDALITSVADPSIRLLNNSISSYKGESAESETFHDGLAADLQQLLAPRTPPPLYLRWQLGRRVELGVS